MLNYDRVQELKAQGRRIYPADPGDDDLGPLKLLPGTWKNLPNLEGRGWNMIALPFAINPGNRPFRVLVNQYNEELKFSLVDKAVPNRGIRRNGTTVDADQLVVTLDYEQMIAQIAAADFPDSGKAGPPKLPIHHEPGLWLHMTNEIEDGADIARLATIPHGDSVLALGNSAIIDGPPDIPTRVNALPIGAPQDLEFGYLAPYKHFHENPFLNLFDPTDPSALLIAANVGVNIVRTTVLEVDTTVDTAGISNIPFIVKQANASDMKSTFWIQELAEKDDCGLPKLRLQYLQVVNLDFFPRFDGAAGRIKWPHISINTMEKVVGKPDLEVAKMPYAAY